VVTCLQASLWEIRTSGRVTRHSEKVWLWGPCRNRAWTVDPMKRSRWKSHERLVAISLIERPPISNQRFARNTAKAAVTLRSFGALDSAPARRRRNQFFALVDLHVVTLVRSL
jgi:hypothetical protein